MICGGFDHKTGMSDQCFELDDSKKFQPSTKLSTRRSNAAAVVINDKVIQTEKVSNQVVLYFIRDNQRSTVVCRAF